MFLYHQKLSFWALILWSFDQNSLKYQFCLKFWPMLTCKMVHQICCSFYWSIRKLSELGRKADFSNHFEKVFFFAYSLLHPMSYNPTFWQMKDLLKIYICGKFYQYSICVCEVNNFQGFSYWFSCHEWWGWALLPQMSGLTVSGVRSLAHTPTHAIFYLAVRSSHAYI